jgi:hypothetical protein
MNATPLAFRAATSGSLSKILALSGPAPIDNGVRIDDLAYFYGTDLTNPLVGFDPGLSLDASSFTIQGNFSLSSGTTLKFDIFDPGNSDRLDIQGALIAGGTLNVTLVTGAPTPQVGDIYDILDFDSAGGSFATLNLPTLGSGLAWNTNSLLTSGELQVVLAGDHNADGNVSAADYVLWRKLGMNAAGYDAWRANFGAIDVSGSSNGVPEPEVLVPLSFAVVFAASVRIVHRSERETRGSA